MFFEWALDHIHNLIFARALVKGKAVSTEKIADALCEMSTVTKGDVMGTLYNLPKVMFNFMSQGKSVRLVGLGIFKLAINGKGVASLDEVNLESQKEAIRVNFTPERTRNSNGTYNRPLVDTDSIEWFDLTDYTALEAAIAKATTAAESTTEETSTEEASTGEESAESNSDEDATGGTTSGDADSMASEA